MFLHLDCRHYLGDRPCRFLRACEGCPHYVPMGPRVLIIKLGALGDVVRTGCLLPGLAAAAEPPHVTWLTSPAARPLVERMPGVHRVLGFDAAALAHLEIEQFDTVISLDKEPAPCAVAMRVRAEQRLGVGLSRYGTVFPLNEPCEYYFSLGLDNDEKFHRNRKSYPQLVYEALGMAYAGERYTLELTEADRASARQRFEAFDVPDAEGAVWIGINAGAGNVFANKAWREAGYIELINELARRRPEVHFLMLGGPDEADLMRRVARTAGAGDGAAAGRVRVHLGGADNSLPGFAALIERCAVVISGDTLAMHLALALGRRVVAIFGPTCEQEIDLFGLGEKVVTPIDCAPCYKRKCEKSPSCQDLVSMESVLAAVLRQIPD